MLTNMSEKDKKRVTGSLGSGEYVWKRQEKGYWQLAFKWTCLKKTRKGSLAACVSMS